MMRSIVFNKKNIELTENFDKTLFENISWSYDNFRSHHDIAAFLENKRPYIITVLIEVLNYKLRNKKEYVKKTKAPMVSCYRELLYDEFFKEYGEAEGDRLFGEWLDKYRPIWQKEKKYEILDEYIVVNEFEPRYREKILARFKNHEALFKDRFRIQRRRYYTLPEPLNYLDYRNPFDNIFVWHENGKKVARRGGSGSSGSREINSMFIFGLLELNKKQPIPTYLFIYSEDNKLLFVKKFGHLCVPLQDIGSNYQLDREEEKQLKRSGVFLRWEEISKIKEIETVTTSKMLKLAIDNREALKKLPADLCEKARN